MSTAQNDPIDTTLDVINKLGLHARACGKLIEVTSRHRCDIRIGRDDALVDAKNIMALLMLGAGKGSTLRLVIQGSDQDKAHDAIRELFALRFHEAE
ncbi:HPr family phosphocarrier protein [Aquirhabdus sp.]|uniref:HPr family phosphocarrier protein n=1 Tax=Aquirhabdus sp. TaxID=2824160 RepID=UPI00396CC9BB